MNAIARHSVLITMASDSPLAASRVPFVVEAAHPAGATNGGASQPMRPMLLVFRAAQRAKSTLTGAMALYQPPNMTYHCWQDRLPGFTHAIIGFAFGGWAIVGFCADHDAGIALGVGSDADACRRRK